MNQPERTWNRRVHTTKDGSPTLQVVEWGVCYHSIHGALTESLHVFIEHGLNRWKADRSGDDALDVLRVVEVGFGTGLNAALAWQWAETQDVHLEYVGVEPFPLTPEEVKAWGAEALPRELETRIAALHAEGMQGLKRASFSARVVQSTWQEFQSSEAFDVCFFDAFAPAQQPELWSVEVFESVLSAMRPGGILATYCAKGQVRRNLEAAGWKVERHPGPPGKREMLVGRHVPVTRWNVRCYALILNPKRTHVLVARERFPDGSVGCKFPGGGVEPEELLVDALWRECREELGSTDGLTWLRHAYTNDFFVRSAFRDDEQILSVYHWMQADHESLAWWDEKPSEVAAEEPILEMNWEPIASMTPDAMRFPIDRHVVQHVLGQVDSILSVPTAD